MSIVKRISCLVLLLITATGAFAQNVQRSELSINVKNYGATPDDSTDDTAAFQAAVAALPNGYGRIYIPRGVYIISDTITIAKDRVHIEGDGRWATQILFAPTSAPTDGKPAFAFAKADVSYECSLRRLAIASSETTLKKVAVRLVDVSRFVLEDVAVGPVGNWTGNGSIGVQIQGRELGSLSRVTLSADIPVKVEHNAHYTGSLLDFDIWHFQDVDMAAAAGQHCIWVADGVSVTNFVMESCAFLGGQDGFYWKDTNPLAPAGIAYGLTIRDTRAEMLEGGWIAYVETNRAIRNVIFDHVQGGAGEHVKGYYIRGAMYVEFRNCHYSGGDDPTTPTNGAIGLDVDGSLSLSMTNCFWNTTTTRNMGTLRRLFAMNAGHESDVYNTEFWESDTNTKTSNGFDLNIGGGTAGASGANLAGGSGTIANNNFVTVPTGGGGAKVMMVTVFIKTAGGQVEGGTALVSSGGIIKLSGTAAFDVAYGANRIALDLSTSGWPTLKLYNTLGSQVSFGYTVTWI